LGGLGDVSGLLERAGFSALLGRWRRGVDSLDRIDTLEDWRALHARPGHHKVARTETVKFVIDLAAGGRVTYQPVVLGVAYGYVRLVRGTQSMSAVRPTDLVVSEWVPEHIGPVAGLVTSQMQAPLAHVAVLTRNRNTPNMGLRGASGLDAFTRLEGQLVKLGAGGPAERDLRTLAGMGSTPADNLA
jgi:hypothetical protein